MFTMAPGIFVHTKLTKKIWQPKSLVKYMKEIYEKNKLIRVKLTLDTH